MRLLVTIIDTYSNVPDLSYWILIGIIIVNLILLISGYFKPTWNIVNDFKSPETDSVFKDFGRLLCNIKVNYYQ